MTNAKDDLRRLVEGLYLGTLNGKVKWTYDSASDLCESKLGDGYVQTVRETDNDGDYFSYVKVLNASKQVIDNIYGGTLSNGDPVNTSHKNYWTLMGDLREVAERQALGADKVISSILDDLGAKNLSLDDVPF